MIISCDVSVSSSSMSWPSPYWKRTVDDVVDDVDDVDDIDDVDVVDDNEDEDMDLKEWRGNFHSLFNLDLEGTGHWIIKTS